MSRVLCRYDYFFERMCSSYNLRRRRKLGIDVVFLFQQRFTT